LLQELIGVIISCIIGIFGSFLTAILIRVIEANQRLHSIIRITKVGIEEIQENTEREE
jgi:uncharacterized membrane protein YeaQ/YmgE (transglycosylase-associated protein family)